MIKFFVSIFVGNWDIKRNNFIHNGIGCGFTASAIELLDATPTTNASTTEKATIVVVLVISNL
jgi:hypothetical protein